MQWLNTFLEKYYAFADKVRPVLMAIGRFLQVLGSSFYKIGLYMYRLRSILLAAPVAAAAMLLAQQNLKRLPETVEITRLSVNPDAELALFGFLEMTTEYITRDMAVYGPAMITAVCLLMMMLSKRTLYPFIISIFSLCIPLVLYFFCIYPM
ncbi:MAG: hypothetical protein IKY59_00900 [Oscillospiraceae bacterium]|nr:hypothetical protein [Oscillospiraceae bacterium]